MIINPYIYGVATSYDPDAQLFFNAQTGAGVTLTTTQMNAVNQWVVDSKAIGIWTKMKAVYPMVGGTATAHKFNLKNPLDTNAAFRLSFIGGGTHSSNGYQPNGVNAYADTFLIPSTTLTLNSQHINYYSRTNANGTEVEIGCNNAGAQPNTLIEIRTTGVTYLAISSSTYTTYTDANSLGFYLGSRTASGTKLYKNNAIAASSVTTASGLPVQSIGLGALNSGTLRQFYSTKQCAFASIGDGLTDLESQLFYQITEKYQVALSRNVNTTQSFYYNSAYNNETNAFLFSTQITDNTIQTATNTLVSDLKTANIFTKMKAIYPMVGGTATTCKFNLVNAQDSNAAYRLVFSGGGTFSSNGIQFNGTNSYADTFLNSLSNLTAASTHLSFYSRTATVGAIVDMGNSNSVSGSVIMHLRAAANFLAGSTAAITNFTTTASALGFWLGSKRANNDRETYLNGVPQLTNITNDTTVNNSLSIYLGASNVAGIANNYSSNQCAFASIGDGLTDAEALAFYNAVQTFNTSLSRNV